MQRHTRQVVDRSFTLAGVISIVLLAAALVVILAPIVYNGSSAFIFSATVEHRKSLLDMYGHGDVEEVEAETAETLNARQPVYDMLAAFEAELADDFMLEMDYADRLEELRVQLRLLLGPLPGDPKPTLDEHRYGETRWNQARAVLHQVMYIETYGQPVTGGEGEVQLMVRTDVPRSTEHFAGTSLEAMFPYLEQNVELMLRPQRTFYWRFLTDTAATGYYFGGIWGALSGTFYLTLGAALFAIPMGVISAIYLVEYANEESLLVRLLRTCISTLAGVPSIVFGLFGLALFLKGFRIGELHIRVSETKSILAGSLTLATLILPIVIRSAEEAIRAVPQTFKEASLSLGASKWRTVATVILPAALPGILTGIVLSMGRAAGETAPIIFTAAVAAGAPVSLGDALFNNNDGTPALPWNIYNLCSEHPRAEAVRHVQYGMVFTLVMLVLLLSSVAIYLRARIATKLRK